MDSPESVRRKALRQLRGPALILLVVAIGTVILWLEAPVAGMLLATAALFLGIGIVIGDLSCRNVTEEKAKQLKAEMELIRRRNVEMRLRLEGSRRQPPTELSR